MLQPTPGALSPHLLEQRPANLPTALFVSGGRSASSFSVVAFSDEGPQLISGCDQQQLLELRRLGMPLWVRINGLGDHDRVTTWLCSMGVQKELLPPMLQVPQRARVAGLDDAVLVLLHRLHERVAVVFCDEQRDALHRRYRFDECFANHFLLFANSDGNHMNHLSQ